MVMATTTPHFSTPPTLSFRRKIGLIPSRLAPPLAARTRIRMVAMASASSSSGGDTLRLLEAAKHVVDNYIRNGMVIGLGSGYASGVAIQYLGRRLKGGDLKNIVGIPMSVSSATDAAKAGIPLNHYQDNLQIDFAFDDADAIEEGSLSAIIGRRKLEGGESILEEKSIIKVAKNLAFIANEKQYTKEFEGSIPVVVQSVNWMQTAEEIDDLFLGDAEVWRRPAFGHADPLGGDFPLVTKEGHHILDLRFTSPILDLSRVAESLDQIEGVIGHGLIIDVPCTAVIAVQDGLHIVDNMAANVMKEL